MVMLNVEAEAEYLKTYPKETKRDAITQKGACVLLQLQASVRPQPSKADHQFTASFKAIVISGGTYFLSIPFQNISR